MLNYLKKRKSGGIQDGELEEDYIKHNLKLLYGRKINFEGLPHTTVRGSIMTRKSSIDVYCKVNKDLPIMLARTGTMGMHLHDKDSTYIYSVGDNILSKISHGKIVREIAPEKNLARWGNMKKYSNKF